MVCCCVHSAHLVDIEWAGVVDGRASPQVAMDYEVSRVSLSDRAVECSVFFPGGQT